MNQASLIAEFRTQIRDVVPTMWTQDTAYVSGQRVTNTGNIYLAVTSGTSSSTGTGPSGTTAGQQDGSVYWNYLGPVGAPALSDLEVIQFITDGFRTYSRYQPLKKSTTLNIVSGQSTYTLPSDWVMREYTSWEEAINPPRVPDPMTMSGFEFIAEVQLIARPMAYATDISYDFYDDQLQLVITPTPQTAYSLTFDYFASHSFDASSCTVPLYDVDNALLPALVKGLRSIATDFSVKLQMYKFSNNLQVDNRTIAGNLQARADELDAQFTRDIIRRPIGVAR